MSKFSGGACPQTPLEKVAFGHLNIHSRLLLYGQTPTSNLVESPGSITQPSSSGILQACVLVASKFTLVNHILCLEKYKAAWVVFPLTFENSVVWRTVEPPLIATSPQQPPLYNGNGIKCLMYGVLSFTMHMIGKKQGPQTHHNHFIKVQSKAS